MRGGYDLNRKKLENSGWAIIKVCQQKVTKEYHNRLWYQCDVWPSDKGMCFKVLNLFDILIL